jgi:hypothetical protein
MSRAEAAGAWPRGACFVAALVLGGLAMAAAAAGGGRADAHAEAKAPRKAPLIHVTDLYHPHGDPDDHWDLACVYALARAGRFDLKAVVIDHPPPRRPGGPDVVGVAQMNAIAGLNVPVVVGAPKRMKTPDDPQPAGAPAHHAAARTILRILRESPAPVVLTVTGACRDVALAGKRAPDVFAAKCAAVYVNAGSGTPERAKAARLEYNVGLDAAAYAAIFDLPCRVYWLPCFEVAPGGGGGAWRVARHGTFYRFRQGEILPHVSPRVQQFLLYMLSRSTDPRWLRYLEARPDEKLLARFGGMNRNMWCTAGFFHAAGSAVTRDGKVVATTQAKDGAVYAFEPVRVTCDEKGVTTWRADPAARKRFMFRVRDPERYAAAMTKAMRSLLATLP